MTKLFWILLLAAVFRITGYAQDAQVNIQMKNVTIESVLTEIEKQTEYRFFYDSEAVKVSDAVTVSWSSKTVSDALTELFSGRGIAFRLIERQIVLYVAPINTGATQTNTRRTTPRFTVSGFMRDSLTTESLISATVYNAANRAGTSTNLYGFYSLTLPAGEVELVYSYVGYNSQTVSFQLRRDTTININLSGSVHLQEVAITADRTSRIQETTQMSATNVPVAQIKSLPAFLGEVDVLKILQLLPGIQSGNEGSSGLYIRGGGPDQNLILLDGVPVYNASHLFGFFSVFNADVINNVDIIKGGFPARYGGRASSVLDISMKEGNMQEFHGVGSVGLVSSKLTLEGPIIKDKTSFIVSGRRSYNNNLINSTFALDNRQINEDVSMNYYFYDLTAKINHRFSEKDRIYLSAYMGNDRFNMHDDVQFANDSMSHNRQSKGEMKWGNITASFRWNHIFTNRLFSNITLAYSRYRYNDFLKKENLQIYDRFHIDMLTGHEDHIIDNRHEYYEFLNESGIQDWIGKITFDYLPSPNHYVRFGVNATYHTFNIGANAFYELKHKEIINGEQFIREERTIGNIGNLISSKIYAWEHSIYTEDDIRLTERLKTNVGLHWSAFNVGDKFHNVLQPRISVRYLFTAQLSAKASYSRMAQYLHLLSNSGIGLPTDLWVPSTAMLRPQTSNQVATGLAQNFREAYEISIEGYYKTMNNVLELSEGSGFFDGKSWDKRVVQGTGRSYGVELFTQKKTGSLTGWIGYTLSWTDRLFDDLNNGKRFPYKYDRRHDISIAASKRFGRMIEMSGAWVFGTGHALTPPVGIYHADDPLNLYDKHAYWTDSYFDYGERNSYRMKAYHRLDLSITFTLQTKRVEHKLVAGAYNAYNRKNPFYIDVERPYHSDNKIQYKFVQYSLFQIIPSISYHFKF